MKKIGIIYGSTTGTTEIIAKEIGSKLAGSEVIDVSSVSIQDFKKYDILILGSSTWGLGELQSDWEGIELELTKVDLNGKKVALFGTGDQISYPDTFADAIGLLKSALGNSGAEFIGSWSTGDYIYASSKAEEDGKLLGLAIDEDNQMELSSSRIDGWVEQIKSEF